MSFTQSRILPFTHWQARLLFVHGAYLPPAVVAAVLADDVRELQLVALRALAERHRLERIVRASFRCAGFRVSSFGIRHGLLLFPKILQRRH